jgi:hypothetical protein
VTWRFWNDAARSRRFLTTATTTGWFLVRWLAVAYAIESLMIAWLPVGAVANWLGAGAGPLAVPLAVAIGIPIYLNSFAAIPFVSGLISLGMSPATGLAFMLATSATGFPAMVAVWALVKPRAFALYPWLCHYRCAHRRICLRGCSRHPLLISDYRAKGWALPPRLAALLVRVPSARSKDDPNDRQHHRNYHEHSDDGRQCRTGLKTKQRDSRCHGKLEEMRRSDQRRWTSNVIVARRNPPRTAVTPRLPRRSGMGATSPLALRPAKIPFPSHCCHSERNSTSCALHLAATLKCADLFSQALV